MDSFNDQNLPLESGHFYHIYNRGNHGNSIFFSQENYRYFLAKYDQYLSKYVDTLAYCLMNNHFHFLIRIKNNDVILQEANNPLRQHIDHIPGEIVSEQFR